MKRITKLFLLLVIALMAVSPAFAFGGISGVVVDGYGNPWIHGGEVYVFNTNTGDMTAVCFVSTVNGSIVDENGGPCDYGDDDQAGVGLDGSAAGAGLVTVADPAHNANMTLYIDFNPGPLGDPGDYSVTYNEIDSPSLLWDSKVKGFGYINTSTGPNAVTLKDFSAQSSSPALFVLAGVALLALASGALAIARKRLA